MSMRLRTSVFSLLFLASAWYAVSQVAAEPEPSTDASAAEGPRIEDTAQAFDLMMQVLSHRRCINCHPAGDRPHQGEDSHLHRLGVQRGPEGHGTAALTCHSCHQSANNDDSGVPGAPHWHLAPRSMAWEGLSRSEIARSMLDPARNGGRSPAEIEHHLIHDPLVLWAFEPGVDHEGTPREAPPVAVDTYIAAVKAWFAAGSPIPDN